MDVYIYVYALYVQHPAEYAVYLSFHFNHIILISCWYIVLHYAILLLYLHCIGLQSHSYDSLLFLFIFCLMWINSTWNWTRTHLTSPQFEAGAEDFYLTGDYKLCYCQGAWSVGGSEFFQEVQGANPKHS